MSDQIDLRKKLPSKATPWIEWHGWTSNNSFEWLEQLYRTGSQVHVGDVTEGSREHASPEEAQAALQRAVAEKLADGFEHEAEPPARPPPKASKPWPKGKAKAPRWLKNVPSSELARIRRAIANAKLEHRRADIESLLRPAIRFATKGPKSSAAKGVATRFGGDPDAPAAFVWPKRGKVPLAFLAQYRLDELAKLDLEGLLPKRGVLAIFAKLVLDGGGYGEHAVAFHFPDVKALVRTAPPHARDADGRPSAVATATARLALTVPPPDHRAAQALALGDDTGRYHDDVWLATCGDAPSHQLLGWPNAMTTPAMSAGNTLLAQIDSDDRFGFELGDVETLRIHIAASKLAAGDFRRIHSATTAE